MAEAYASRIQGLLEPLVGAFVAKMAVNFQCKAMGIRPEDIGAEHLPDLAARIGTALEVQGKQAEARSIVDAIRNLR